jgi:Flp pilus assembly protein TadD
VPVRVVLVVLAAVLVVALSLRLGDHDVCGDARRAVFGATTGQTPAAEVARHVRTVEERCRGSEALVATAGALRTAGDDAAAARLAREAARREPESFSAWRALAAVGDREEAERARRRALELNPRWAPPR